MSVRPFVCSDMTVNSIVSSNGYRYASRLIFRFAKIFLIFKARHYLRDIRGGVPAAGQRQPRRQHVLGSAPPAQLHQHVHRPGEAANSSW